MTPPQNSRILIVDDHEENLLALEAVLDEPRYEVVRANSGRAALRAALQGDFAVVILDVAMPDMDGFETATLLRERQRSRDTPIIFLTANYRSEGHVFRGYSVGAVDYITKPFSPDVLKSKVAVFVELYEKREALKRHALALQEAHDVLEQRVRERTAALATAARVEHDLRRQAEQVNRLKDEFLATLSHELRTPLNAILGWTHLLEIPTDDPTMAKRALAVIKNNAVAQSQIIEDILDVSRIIGGKLRLTLRPCLIQEAIDSAIDSILPAAVAKGITLERDLAEVGPVVIDRDRMQQVCWNLLSNAVKFTPKGGTVSVKLVEREEDLVLTVTDTGAGIAPEFLPRIFDRFSQADSSATRRHGGLGLGMAIVRHLVELHGGTATAFSAGLDQGSMFTLVLPRRVAKPGEQFQDDDGKVAVGRTTVPTESDLTLTGQTVLMIDADNTTREALAAALRQSGAAVIEAPSGNAALEIARHSSVDVIVSRLPLADMTGTELIRRVDALAGRARIAAIALSENVRVEDVGAALDAGFHLHLGLPTDAAQLATAVDAVTRVKPASTVTQPSD